MLRSESLGATVEVAVMWEREKQDNSWRCKFKGVFRGALCTEKAMAPTPILLPGKSHGRRSLVACSQWRHEESDTTEQLHFHFSLSCIGEGNGNPLQCFYLENPRDRGACWSAIYGVTQSRTPLKWLSSSSNSICYAWKKNWNWVSYFSVIKLCI